MANPKFTWNPEGYSEFMNSQGVLDYLSEVAAEIVIDANAKSQYWRNGKRNFYYKVLKGERKPIAIIYTASWPGMYEQAKNNTLKKALLSKKQGG